MASVLMAYILWLFGGILGIHHLYLNRVMHAIIWFCTGGGFGFGLVMDFFCMPDYVHETNEIQHYIQNTENGTKAYCTTTRFFGECAVGWWFGILATILIPLFLWESIYGQFMAALTIAFSVSIGVYMVGNIGLQKRSLRSAFPAAFVVAIYYCVIVNEFNCALLTAIACATSHNRTVKWRNGPHNYHIWHFVIFASIFAAVLVYAAIFHVQFFMDGRVVNIAHVVNESELWSYICNRDWWTIHEDLWDFLENGGSLFAAGELAKAYETLGLSSSATQSKVRSQCRHLIALSHPDSKSSHNRVTYTQVRKACELLGWRRHG